MAATGCTPQSVATAFVTGLNQPRGIAFDDAGTLYVAEAGALTADAQGQGTVGENHSGRVSAITQDGQRSVVQDRLPYIQQTINGDIGPADVAILAGELYVLTGEGRDENLARRLLHVRPGERAGRVANFLNFALPGVGQRDPELGSIKTNPFAVLPAPDDSGFYVSDGASGRILQVGLDGELEVFATLPGAPPLTGMAYGPDGRLYVALFSVWPHARGDGAIWAVDTAGQATPAVEELTMPIDVAFDRHGRLYVLEFSGGGETQRPYAPRRGRLLRFDEAVTAGHPPDITRDPLVVLDELNYPTSMLFSPAGDLYLAIGGAFTEEGQGSVVKVAGCTLGTVVPEVEC